MWIARNKNGELRIFEMPPRRFHDGPMIDSNLVGFNNAVSVGNDEYSFWAVQENCCPFRSRSITASFARVSAV